METCQESLVVINTAFDGVEVNQPEKWGLPRLPISVLELDRELTSFHCNRIWHHGDVSSVTTEKTH